jgi:hypothetical protein
MAVPGLLATVFAQTCLALLPPARAEIEWFRDGQPYARDVPLRATRTARVYRRQHERGPAVERVLSCTTAGGVSYFSDRIGRGAAVRLPVRLEQGGARVVDRTTVRRIEPPTGGSERILWFSVSSPGITVYGLQPRAGMVEIRTPSPAGGVSVLRAVTREPRVVTTAANAQARRLAQRVAELERTVQMLTDSIRELLAHDASQPARHAPVVVPEFGAADVYVERGELDEAIALLMGVQARLMAWSDSTATLHRARHPPRQPNPYTADQIERLLRGGVPPEKILADARRECIAFRVAPDVVDALVRAGAPPAFVQDLGAACYYSGSGR